jgi:DNA-binding NtrC family response regulator
VHQLSRRKKQPFIAVNCGAVSTQLIESELFGHERGSFTGAERQHKGFFERAAGGTLFLDEITEMPLDLQVRLLRVLETGSLLRVGGERDIRIDVRVIAATNRDPAAAVAEGKLREDLLYRLSVFPIQLPPLRERGDDVELLAESFLARLNEAEGTSKRFTRGAMRRLRSHGWPGNVRELANAVQRAFILADEEIDQGSLPLPAAARSPEAGGTGDGSTLQLRIGTTVADAERRLILATLDEFGGNKEQAAKALGVSLKTLYNKLNRYKAS